MCIVNLSTYNIDSCFLSVNIDSCFLSVNFINSKHNTIKLFYCLAGAMQCNDWHNVTIYVNRE